MIETYKLKAPITVSGNKIEKVDLREPTFNEISAMGLPGDASTPDEKLSLLRKYVVTCSGLRFFYRYGVGQKKMAVKVFYNTARFWSERPTELSKEPFSRVVELAKEALRIMEEDKKWQEKNTVSRPSYRRPIR